MTTPAPTQRQAGRLLVLLLLLGAAAANASAGQPGPPADEYRRLVRLGQERRDRAEFDRHGARLAQLYPESGAVFYTQALLLTDQHRYGEAVCSTARALTVDRGNLNLWKLHIWLQLRTEQFRPALDSVAQLAGYMPDDTATGSRRAKGEQMAEYFGTIAGYVEFPRGGDLPAYDVTLHRQRIRGRLTSSQQGAFDRGYGRVQAVAANQAGLIEEHRQRAYEADVSSRDAVIAQMAAERSRIRDELRKLEDLRMQDKALGSAERNTLAATRETFVSGAASREAADGVTVGRDRTTGVGIGAGGVQTFDTRRRYAGVYDHDYADASFAAGSKGFGAGAYRSVEERAKDYDKYLTRRGDKLYLQLQVMERKEIALRNKPAVGASPLVARLIHRSRRLTEYLALPVEPRAEVARLLARVESAASAT